MTLQLLHSVFPYIWGKLNFFISVQYKYTVYRSLARPCSIKRIWIYFTRQMKGRWESNINAWFPCMYFQKWNCYFHNRIIMFCLPVPTLIYLWEIYIFPGPVCLFWCRKICGPILGIYKSLIETWSGNWDWGRPIPRKGINKWDFRCSAQATHVPRFYVGMVEC